MKDNDLRTVLNQELAGFFGRFTARLDVLERKLDAKADGERVYQALDGIAARLTERAALSARADRLDA